MATSSSGRAAGEDEEDWVKAKIGINLLINKSAREAMSLFEKYPDSLPMYAGYSFAALMDALMTFEDDKLNLATNVLKEVERKCTIEANQNGWLRSVKTKVFGNSQQKLYNQPNLAMTLETQIILADSLVCMAILTFLQQDISGFFKGGWVLRKSWKIYQNVYNDVKRLYREMVGDSPLPDDVSGSFNVPRSLESLGSFKNASSMDNDPSSLNGYINNKISHSKSANSDLKTIDDEVKNRSCNFTFLKKSRSVNSALSKHLNKQHETSYWGSKLSPFTSSLSLAYLTSTLHIFSASSSQSTDKLNRSEIDKDTVIRLMGAVSFGYGLFQLGISLLPPSLLKLTNFLGFGGNRQNGIDCLMYARNGVDMRAPLATLSLLWYHTIVRPFYALDGSNVQAGVTAATQLLQESELEYGQSSLFLFFKGRVNRLNSDIPSALDSFQLAVENANQREIKILALHEVGWCHLIELDYCAAEGTFIYLKSWSRWSKAFYCYLAGICTGSCENSSNQASFNEIRTHVHNISKGGTHLDDFLARRAKCCPDQSTASSVIINPIYWKLLVYEMLYLWNALPSCSHENIDRIKQDCGTISSSGNREPMTGLSELLLGSCYCIQKSQISAIEHFRKCLELRKNLAINADDAHISAFAQYELGTLLIKSPETKDEGKSLLIQINQYKDYDFEQRLNVRVHSTLKHL